MIFSGLFIFHDDPDGVETNPYNRGIAYLGVMIRD